MSCSFYVIVILYLYFFFSSRRRHTRFKCDWSSDVCSSDLPICVRKGFNKVSVEMRVKSKASVDELTECAMFSPVYEMVSKALPVEFKLSVY